jgi:hypothetical protein
MLSHAVAKTVTSAILVMRCVLQQGYPPQRHEAMHYCMTPATSSMINRLHFTLRQKTVALIFEEVVDSRLCFRKSLRLLDIDDMQEEQYRARAEILVMKVFPCHQNS